MVKSSKHRRGSYWLFGRLPDYPDLWCKEPITIAIYSKTACADIRNKINRLNYNIIVDFLRPYERGGIRFETRDLNVYPKVI